MTVRVTIEKEIEIEGITLLTGEEYEAAKDVIPRLPNRDWWWLRTPWLCTPGGWGQVLYVDEVGFKRVSYVDDILSVRPASKIKHQGLNGPAIGGKFELAGVTWTMISPEIALCDSSIGNKPFKRDWELENSNEYRYSDIRYWLERWAKDHGIIVSGRAVA